MGFSDVVAVLAFLISVVSAWISFKSYRYSVDTNESENHRGFSREKSEFLVRIEKALKSFDQLERQLKGLFQKIEDSSNSAQFSVSKEINELNADLNHLEGCQRQARSLWQETYEMNQDGFAHHKPRFLKLIEGDEEFARQASQRSKLMDQKL